LAWIVSPIAIFTLGRLFAFASGGRINDWRAEFNSSTGSSFRLFIVTY